MHALFDLTGRTALVTGSSRGIGLGIARALASAGARVVLNGRDPDALAAAARALAVDGVDAPVAAFDVTDEAAVVAAVAGVEREVGPIDILVNNSGITVRASLEDLDTADWDRVIGTNLTGAFKVGRAVARHMIPRRRGKIVNICSVLSEIARPTAGAYTAAKGGLRNLTRAMAVDWARHGIQANAIGPGYIVTDFTRALMDDPTFNAWLDARVPMARWGEVSDLAGAAIFLCSPASDFVTGQVLYVDGGMTASV
jgi:gluconate 5-dehydrogenase